MPFLTAAAGLGQALTYIRPLQKDLDTSNVESKGQVRALLIFMNLMESVESTFTWGGGEAGRREGGKGGEEHARGKPRGQFKN